MPTIFSRLEYLPLAVKSTNSSEDCFLLLSSPTPTAAVQGLINELFQSRQIDAHLIETPGLPLAKQYCARV